MVLHSTPFKVQPQLTHWIFFKLVYGKLRQTVIIMTYLNEASALLNTGNVLLNSSSINKLTPSLVIQLFLHSGGYSCFQSSQVPYCRTTIHTSLMLALPTPFCILLFFLPSLHQNIYRGHESIQTSLHLQRYLYKSIDCYSASWISIRYILNHRPTHSFFQSHKQLLNFGRILV